MTPLQEHTFDTNLHELHEFSLWPNSCNSCKFVSDFHLCNRVIRDFAFYPGDTELENLGLAECLIEAEIVPSLQIR